jgi:hypothetical protein
VIYVWELELLVTVDASKYRRKPLRLEGWMRNVKRMLRKTAQFLTVVIIVHYECAFVCFGVFADNVVRIA